MSLAQRFPDAAELAGLASLYRLAQLRPERPLAGLTNANLLCASPEGALVVRVLQPRARLGVQRAIQDLRAALRRAGLPIPVARADRHGERTFRLGDRWGEVYPYRPGTAFAYDAAQVPEAARALRELHRAGQALGRTVRAAPWPPVGHLRQGLLRLGWRTGGLAWELLYLARLCDHVERSWPREGLPQTLCHGDYHPGNLVFEGARVVYILDFDRVGFGERLADVCRFLLALLPDRPELARRFVEAYEDLTALERRTIPLGLLRTALGQAIEAATHAAYPLSALQEIWHTFGATWQMWARQEAVLFE